MSYKIDCKTFRPNTKRTFKYAHAKLDGQWLEVRRHWETGVVEARTSLPTDITAKLEYLPWFRQLCLRLPDHGVVYGELFVPGEQAAAVSTHIAQQTQQLCFMPFAAEWDGLLPDASLATVETEILRRLSLTIAPHFFLAGLGASPESFIANEWQQFWKGRYEGIVFKNGNLLDWHKFKEVLTCECLVLDYTDGAGKYEGKVGALVLGLSNHIGEFKDVAFAGGMTDSERDEMTTMAEEDTLTGRVAEIAYQCVGSGGRLRHPRFIQWREDRESADCVLDQIRET
jgi:hypothetical protein